MEDAENFLFDRGWLNKSETIARGVLRPCDPSNDYGKFLLKEHDQAAPHGQSRQRDTPSAKNQSVSGSRALRHPVAR